MDVFYIPGAFLKADLNGKVEHIKFEGRIAELLAMIDPKIYRPNIMVENDKYVSYPAQKITRLNTSVSAEVLGANN